MHFYKSFHCLFQAALLAMSTLIEYLSQKESLVGWKLACLFFRGVLHCVVLFHFVKYTALHRAHILLSA